MRTSSLRERLQQAERHVAKGRAHVERQEQVLKELERDGHDTKAALELLAAFQRSQAQHVGHRDRLIAELAKLKK